MQKPTQVTNWNGGPFYPKHDTCRLLTIKCVTRKLEAKSSRHKPRWDYEKLKSLTLSSGKKYEQFKQTDHSFYQESGHVNCLKYKVNFSYFSSTKYLVMHLLHAWLGLGANYLWIGVVRIEQKVYLKVISDLNKSLAKMWQLLCRISLRYSDSVFSFIVKEIIILQ